MHNEAQRNAIRTLSKLSYWPEGFSVVAVLKVLEYASELLVSPDSGTRGGTCEILGNMAFHKLTTASQMVVGLSIQIVSLLRHVYLKTFLSSFILFDRDTDIQVQRQALCALSKTTYWAKVAQAIDERAMQVILDVLDSPYDTEVLRWTCEIFNNLALQNPVVIKSLCAAFCMKTVSLMRYLNRLLSGSIAE
jgi:hypothetical protein